MNKIVLIGRLVADPTELKTTNGDSYCRFRVAVDRNYVKADEEKTDFFNCIAWGKLGGIVCKYTKKGEVVAIDGTAHIKNYIDSVGTKRQVFEVEACEVQFFGKKQQENT